MDRQEMADKAEAEALECFLVIRDTFSPCWGASLQARRVVKPPRQRRTAQWPSTWRVP